MRQNKNHVWDIVSNDTPIEAYENEFIAQQVANIALHKMVRTHRFLF